MSNFFLLDNVVCPALPTAGNEDGRPSKFVFFEDTSSTGGPSDALKFTGDHCCEVPDDDGDSWTIADANGPARGAYLWLEVVGRVDMVEITARLNKAKDNQDRILSPSGES